MQYWLLHYMQSMLFKKKCPNRKAIMDLDEFEFVEKKEPVYFASEKIRYKIKWTANADLEDLRLYFAIEDADDGKVIGMTQSEVFASVKEGEQGESILELDASNFVEGKYYKVQVDVHTSLRYSFKLDDDKEEELAWVANRFRCEYVDKNFKSLEILDTLA